MRATRQPSLKPLLVALALVLAPLVGTAFVIVATATLAPDGDRYLPILDELSIPDDWEAVHTETVNGGFMTKARATRYYFANLDPVDSVSVAKAVARAEGFNIRPLEVSSVECDDAPADASACPPTIVQDCRSNNGGLPTDCTVQAFRPQDSSEAYVIHLWINLDRRGSSFTVGTGDERMTVSDPERALIRITVDATEATQFEPTPGSPVPSG